MLIHRHCEITHSNHHNDKGTVSTVSEEEITKCTNQAERTLAVVWAILDWSQEGRFADHGYCSLARTTDPITISQYHMPVTAATTLWFRAPSWSSYLYGTLSVSKGRPWLESFCIVLDSHSACLGSVAFWFGDSLICWFLDSKISFQLSTDVQVGWAWRLFSCQCSCSTSLQKFYLPISFILTNPF